MILVKKIIIAIKTVLKKSRIAGIFYTMFCKWFSVNKRVVLLESHNGKELMGNPYYIVRYLLETPRYGDFKLIVSSEIAIKKALSNIKNKGLVKVCKQHSLRYCYYLATAEFLVSDVTFPVYFCRREKQKYLNTWHGTPLKSLGRKIKNNPFELSNIQRNFFHSTHLLVPNSHTEKVLLEDYMISKIWNGSVLRGGYPRNVIFNKKKNKLTYYSMLKQYNIAFMPTWRGTLKDIKISSKIQLQQLKQLFCYLEKNLPSSLNFWVRLHPLVNQNLDLTRFSKIKPFPDKLEPYEFISQCDALVTDYSSVMFDYAITYKPIVLYIPDEEKYLDERSFCINLSSIPFPKVKSNYELLDILIGLMKKDFILSFNYKEFVNQFCPYDSETSTSDLCKHFFDGKQVLEEYVNNPDRNKKSVLLFVGSFLNNGITTSLKNLLDILDKDRYNFYLLIDRFNGEIRAKDYFQNLDNRINYIPSQNWLSGDLIDGLRFLWRDCFYQNFSENDAFMETLWSREYRRLFCNIKWDTIINFTGYERRITFLMLAAKTKKVSVQIPLPNEGRLRGGVCCGVNELSSFQPAPTGNKSEWLPKKIIFMHNDMLLETKNKKFFDARALKLAYTIADVIAVVRRGIERSYSTYMTNIENKSCFVPNAISYNKYLEMSKADLIESLDLSMQETWSRKVLKALEKSGHFRFINLARFSPEKGQIRLIEAFEKVWQYNSNCQLFIIGGYGNEYESVLQRSRISSASEAIFVLLGSSNPFPIFVRMDAFLLSSFYEGMPMVIYESLALGIPVISTEMPGLSELLNQSYGLIVENSVDGLVQGMIQALGGKIPKRPYDFEKHNQEALKNFCAVID